MRLILLLVLLLIVVTFLSTFKRVIVPIISGPTVGKCINQKKIGLHELDYYLVVATMVKNKRRYIREWIEFHIMMGVSYFFIYDNLSEDGVKDLVQPYIDNGIVSYFLWPPKEEPHEIWDDPKLEEHYSSHMKSCYEGLQQMHGHIFCQIAAYDDAVRRTRGKARWVAGLDVDEFFYLNETSPFVNFQDPLPQAFKNLEDYAIVTVAGQHFGTSGWLTPPRRDDDQEYSSLLTKTHTHHMRYHPGELVKVGEHVKPFANPFCVVGNELHSYIPDTSFIAEKTIHHSDSDNVTIYMNHFLWTSREEQYIKAQVNQNPNALYVKEFDLMINQEEGNAIGYLMNKLEQRMKNAMRNRPSSDGHADDWDVSLHNKHVYHSTAKTDLCVILVSPRHIGLARHALTTIINYFAIIEPSLNYKLIINDADPKIQHELQFDFPVDSVIIHQTTVQSSCPAEFIMNIPEQSFARWFLWPENMPIVKMAMEVFKTDSKVNAIYLGDSSNLMSEWSKAKNVSYRNNPPLADISGTVLRRNIFPDNSKDMFEMCLHIEDTCQGNQIRGLFENYIQERMYGFTKPWVYN
jgi:hypothetical protein